MPVTKVLGIEVQYDGALIPNWMHDFKPGEAILFADGTWDFPNVVVRPSTTVQPLPRSWSFTKVIVHFKTVTEEVMEKCVCPLLALSTVELFNFDTDPLPKWKEHKKWSEADLPPNTGFIKCNHSAIAFIVCEDCARKWVDDGKTWVQRNPCVHRCKLPEFNNLPICVDIVHGYHPSSDSDVPVQTLYDSAVAAWRVDPTAPNGPMGT